MDTILLKNAQLFHNDTFTCCDVLIVGGIIQSINKDIQMTNIKVLDLHGKLVSHNFIDIHTHLREPGYEHKETIETGTKSALYGGYGTIVAMANTLPCMDDVETIRDFAKRVETDAVVNTYTYSAITTNLKGKELVDMEKNARESIVLGFSDDGKGVQNNKMMEAAMKKAKELDSIIVAHCEDESELKGGCIHEGQYAKEHNLVGINSASEYKQVQRDLGLVEQIHNRYHICHISTLETVEALKQSRLKGERVSGEVSPHHLILTEDNIKDCHPNYKMNPPLRSKEDHQALIKGLNNGVITVIATDHAPHAREEKNVDISKAPFGIIGIQHAFPLMYTYLVKKNLVDLKTVLNALTIGPAKTLGLNGEIHVGDKANLAVFDLDKEFEIKEEDIQSKSINTPFLGVRCFGKISMNIINGKINNMEDK